MSSCVAYCVKSNKDRVVIGPHEFISMIHRLVTNPTVMVILQLGKKSIQTNILSREWEF